MSSKMGFFPFSTDNNVTILKVDSSLFKLCNEHPLKP